MKDGVGFDTERLHRRAGCDLIQEAAELLHFPQAAAVTGQNLLHRFYYRKSLMQFDHFTISMGCVLLASKVEEVPKGIREIVMIFYTIYHRRKRLSGSDKLEIGSEQYINWKDELVTAEQYVLKELGYCLYSAMDHPHKYLFYYMKILGGTDELAQVSWNYLNDSMRTDLCVRYPAPAIAASAIYIAARKTGHPLSGQKWYELMEADLQTIYDISDTILQLYEEKVPLWLKPLNTDGLAT